MIFITLIIRTLPSLVALLKILIEYIGIRFWFDQFFNTFLFTLGKASRMLAAKAALACRADALFESLEANNKDKDVKFDPEWIEQRERMNKGELGLEGRTKVETRIRILEGGHSLQVHN